MMESKDASPEAECWRFWADARNRGLQAHGEEEVLQAHESACIAGLFLIAGQHPEVEKLAPELRKAGLVCCIIDHRHPHFEQLSKDGIAAVLHKPLQGEPQATAPPTAAQGPSEAKVVPQVAAQPEAVPETAAFFGSSDSEAESPAKKASNQLPPAWKPFEPPPLVKGAAPKRGAKRELPVAKVANPTEVRLKAEGEEDTAEDDESSDEEEDEAPKEGQDQNNQKKGQSATKAVAHTTAQKGVLSDSDASEPRKAPRTKPQKADPVRQARSPEEDRPPLPRRRRDVRMDRSRRNSDSRSLSRRRYRSRHSAMARFPSFASKGQPRSKRKAEPRRQQKRELSLSQSQRARRDDSELREQRERERKQEESREKIRQEKEKELKEKEHREREQKEKELKEQKERELKEQRERERRDKELKEQRERERREKELKEQRERERREKELKEQRERERRERELKELKEREQRERELKELKEREQRERELKELREREQRERELKELREREQRERELQELRDRERKERERRELEEKERREKELKAQQEREQLAVKQMQQKEAEQKADTIQQAQKIAAKLEQAPPERLQQPAVVLHIGMHHEYPMAQIKLSHEEATKKLLKLPTSSIKGVPVERLEGISSDPKALLILWRSDGYAAVNQAMLEEHFQQLLQKINPEKPPDGPEKDVDAKFLMDELTKALKEAGKGSAQQPVQPVQAWQASPAAQDLELRIAKVYQEMEVPQRFLELSQQSFQNLSAAERQTLAAMQLQWQQLNQQAAQLQQEMQLLPVWEREALYGRLQVRREQAAQQAEAKVQTYKQAQLQAQQAQMQQAQQAQQAYAQQMQAQMQQQQYMQQQAHMQQMQQARMQQVQAQQGSWEHAQVREAPMNEQYQLAQQLQEQMQWEEHIGRHSQAPPVPKATAKSQAIAPPPPPPPQDPGPDDMTGTASPTIVPPKEGITVPMLVPNKDALILGTSRSLATDSDASNIPPGVALQARRDAKPIVPLPLVPEPKSEGPPKKLSLPRMGSLDGKAEMVKAPGVPGASLPAPPAKAQIPDPPAPPPPVAPAPQDAMPCTEGTTGKASSLVTMKLDGSSAKTAPPKKPRTAAKTGSHAVPVGKAQATNLGDPLREPNLLEASPPPNFDFADGALSPKAMQQDYAPALPKQQAVDLLLKLPKAYEAPENLPEFPPEDESDLNLESTVQAAASAMNFASDHTDYQDTKMVAPASPEHPPQSESSQWSGKGASSYSGSKSYWQSQPSKQRKNWQESKHWSDATSAHQSTWDDKSWWKARQWKDGWTESTWNGGEVDWPDQSWESREEVTAQASESLPEGHFRITLVRGNSELWGFQWDRAAAPEGKRFFTGAAPNTVIERWNYKNPGEAVQVGDELIQVNSLTDYNQITLELRQNETVTCEFRKAGAPPAPPVPAPAAQAAAPPVAVDLDPTDAASVTPLVTTSVRSFPQPACTMEVKKLKLPRGGGGYATAKKGILAPQAARSERGGVPEPSEPPKTSSWRNEELEKFGATPAPKASSGSKGFGKPASRKSSEPPLTAFSVAGAPSQRRARRSEEIDDDVVAVPPPGPAYVT